MIRAIPLVTINRIFVVASLVALAPAMLRVADFPTRTVYTTVLGSALTFQLNVNTLLLVLLPALVMIGTDWVLQDHPEVRLGSLRFLFPFWTVPGIAAFTLALLLTRLQDLPTWLVTLSLGSVVIGLLIAAEYNIVDPGSSAYEASRVAVNLTSLALALLLFSLIHSTRERSLITATGAMVVSFALAIDMLAPHLIGTRRGIGAAALIAIIIGQAMWALNYLRIFSPFAGTVLLVIFHVSTLLIQQYFQAQGHIRRDALAEFAILAVVVAALWAWEIAR